MSSAPASTADELVRHRSWYLAPFAPELAGVVAAWARNPQELLWLAPKSTFPLTAAKVLAWPGHDGCPLLFRGDHVGEPLGYVELNPMPGEKRHLWLGHCVIDPGYRGMGLGQRMVRLLLEVGFARRGAERISLVVFPENTRAINCYRAVGFVDACEHDKYFGTTGRQHRMLQMSTDLARYRYLYRAPLPRAQRPRAAWPRYAL